MSRAKSKTKEPMVTIRCVCKETGKVFAEFEIEMSLWNFVCKYAKERGIPEDEAFVEMVSAHVTKSLPVTETEVAA